MKDNEKSFGIFPYQFKVVGYVLSVIGICVWLYLAFIHYYDVFEAVHLFLTVAFMLVAFSKSKDLDERTLYLNTKFLAHAFLCGISTVLLFGLLSFFTNNDISQLSASMWIVCTYFVYFGMKIKYKLLDRKNDEKEI